MIDVYQQLSIAYVKVEGNDPASTCIYEYISDAQGELVSKRKLTPEQYEAITSDMYPTSEAVQLLRTQLAIYAHEAWSGWMKYMFSKCTQEPDGTLRVPTWAVQRWTRQMNTLYAHLPDNEKLSDLAEADKMLSIMTNAPLPIG
jgi:hypothetical protein